MKDVIQTSMHDNRRSLQGSDYLCDAAFLNCLWEDACTECFLEMELNDIDWASVSKDTPCDETLSYIYQKGHCKSLRGKKKAEDLFCDTFQTCIMDEVDDGDAGDDIDCSSLTECDWEGIHASFIGDGVCHDLLDGCYNTAICGYDGGDCCEDTCEVTSDYYECGQDGFFCRDPASEDCDYWLNSNCKNDIVWDDDAVVDPSTVVCKDGESKFRLKMYDSFGDGWDSTKIKIKESSRNKEIFSGSLERGSEGTEYICLSNTPTCYQVDLGGGIWGNEVSWEIKPMLEGAASLASGGSPMNCVFSIGSKCDNTCYGKSNVKPNNDPDYKDYKEMYSCISDKCPVQKGACDSDSTCKPCLGDDPSDFCFSLDKFIAVVNCGLCKCSDHTDEDFCDKKDAPGTLPIPDRKKPNEKAPCTPAETLQGGQAVMAFGKCTDFDQVGMMVTEFSNSNFGDLDSFETCAHAYAKEPLHGGHTALGCLQILVNAMNAEEGDEGYDKDAPVEAIAELAEYLYHDGEAFCDCAKEASDACPLCPSFVNFKTLLYESLDACQSLDEIDCDAWSEFYRPCKNNLIEEFGKVDFSKDAQCDYVHRTCGGVGPFPSFRRLDCGKELPDAAWSFYEDFAKACVDEPGPSPSPPRTPAPYAGPSTPRPSPSPYSPTDNEDSGKKKKYVPPEDRGKKGSSDESNGSDSKKGQSHWFRNLLILGAIGGGGYYYYKRNGGDGFRFVRYKRVGANYGFGGDEGLYSGLAMDSSTTFEPPSLPPTPTTMGGDYSHVPDQF